MKKILAIGLVTFGLFCTYSVSHATSILYQASGTLFYSTGVNQWSDTSVWGSAMISDVLYGSVTYPDYFYSPDWASESYFKYNIDNYVLGCDFGAVAGLNSPLLSEALGNSVLGFASGSIGGITDLVLRYYTFEFLNPDGTPYSDIINTGDRFTDTDYGKLAPVIRLYIDDGRIGDQFISAHGDIVLTRAAPVPEPATMFLLGSGLVSLAVLRKKKLIHFKSKE